MLYREKSGKPWTVGFDEIKRFGFKEACPQSDTATDNNVELSLILADQDCQIFSVQNMYQEPILRLLKFTTTAQAL
jgi:hypothetical protein